MAKILTLDDYMPTEDPTGTLVEKSWPFWLEAYTGPPTGVAPAPLVFAEVNHSRWIGHCPMAGCQGASMVSRKQHRFFCSSCLHAAEPAAAYKWLRVVWPQNVEEIEAALLRRPADENRNWVVGETEKTLLMENIQHIGDTAIDQFVAHLLSEDDG